MKRIVMELIDKKIREAEYKPELFEKSNISLGIRTTNFEHYTELKNKKKKIWWLVLFECLFIGVMAGGIFGGFDRIIEHPLKGIVVEIIGGLFFGGLFVASPIFYIIKEVNAIHAYNQKIVLLEIKEALQKELYGSEREVAN
jgi:hypothetical protein